MSATVTLSTTTLTAFVGPTDGQIKVASTAGIYPKLRLFVDKELMTVVSLGVDPWVNVLRGRDGTAASAHDSTATVYIGSSEQFYSSDPVGAPPDVIPVSPYINVVNGNVWFSQGNSLPVGNNLRWWQLQTPTYAIGPLGIGTVSQTPTSST